MLILLQLLELLVGDEVHVDGVVADGVLFQVVFVADDQGCRFAAHGFVEGGDPVHQVVVRLDFWVTTGVQFTS